jgi:hypothetical protein
MASRLLQSLREIRDLIHDYTLVSEVVLVECGVVPISEATTSRSPMSFKDLTDSFSTRSPPAHRRIWSVPTFDVGEPFSEGDTRGG